MKTIKAIFHGFRLFKDIASASPFRIPLELLSAGLEVFGHIFIRILLVRRILDLVVSGRYLDTFLLIFLSAAADLAVSGFEAWMKEYYRLKDAVRLHEAFQKKLYRRAAGVELMYYDTPEYYDKFLLAAGNSDKTAGKLLQSGREFLVSLSEILLSGGLILSNMSGLLPIVLIPSTLYGFVSVRNARARVEFRTAVTPPQKKMNYAKKIFFTKEAALDLRTTGLKGLLLDLLDEGGEEAVRRGTLSMNKMLFFAFLQGGLFYFQYTALMVVLAYRALTLQSISVGDFSMLFMSALTLGNNWRFFGSTLGELAEYGYFSGQYYDFLRLPVSPAALSGTETEINYTPSDHGSSDIRTTSSRLLHPETKLPVSSAPEESKSDIPHSVEILFTKVSFTYPGNTKNRKEILKEISFSFYTLPRSFRTAGSILLPWRRICFSTRPKTRRRPRMLKMC